VPPSERTWVEIEGRRIVDRQLDVLVPLFPEVLLVVRNNYSIGDWRGRMLGIGINHQSNGRADPLSRSWNRIMVNIGLDRDDWALVARPWWRISDGNEDENPGIEDYIGRGDITLVHRRGGNEFALMARHSLRNGCCWAAAGKTSEPRKARATAKESRWKEKEAAWPPAAQTFP